MTQVEPKPDAVKKRKKPAAKSAGTDAKTPANAGAGAETTPRKTAAAPKKTGERCCEAKTSAQ